MSFQNVKHVQVLIRYCAFFSIFFGIWCVFYHFGVVTFQVVDINGYCIRLFRSWRYLDFDCLFSN